MRRFALLVAVATVLVAGIFFQVSADAQELNNTIMQGRVLKVDDSRSMPRITRPAANNEGSSSSANSAQSPLSGKPPAQEADILKARVLQAAGLGGFTPRSPGTDSAKRNFSLSSAELHRLAQFDIAVLIDASGSMSTPDCDPLNIFSGDGKISRWEWCRQQTSILGQELAPVFPAGITVIPFASRACRYTNVSPSAIGEIFNEVRPGGGTRLDQAIDLELAAYFAKRAQGQQKKPLLIAVITDGVPNYPGLVTQEVIAAIKRSKPGELRIEFFLIGEARRGMRFVDFLSNLKFNAGAPFDLVSQHKFEEVNFEGLPRSLAHAVQ